MYFVDREKIVATLKYLDRQIETIESTKLWETNVEQAALERLTHSIIEGVLDVGNAMIDGFIMRDPGSYNDIIDILLDEEVITEEMSIGLKEVIELRKDLVQDYINIDHNKFAKVITEQLAILKQFSPKVNNYLETKLGPVSAFKR